MIHKDPNSDYGVSFPDLPGCITAGTSLDEARELAAKALAFHLEGLQDDGEPIPEPSSLEAIMTIAENRDGVAILVEAPKAPAKTPARAVRVNIILPADVLAEIDRFAEGQGLSRSGFPAVAAKREM